MPLFNKTMKIISPPPVFLLIFRGISEMNFLEKKKKKSENQNSSKNWKSHVCIKELNKSDLVKKVLELKTKVDADLGIYIMK